MGGQNAGLYADKLFPLSFRFMHDFVALKYGEYPSSAGWCSIILKNCGGDEEKAFDRFFELYDEFRQLRMTECIKYFLTAENIEYNNSMEHCYSITVNGKEPFFNNPIAVYFVRLTEETGWIMAVETMDSVRLDGYRIYASLEKLMKNAEHHFGELRNGIEIGRDNLSFGKNII